MTEGARQVRVFVSSPVDALFERSRLERVVERLSGEFQDVARLTTIRWETAFYKAHETFQTQIPEAAQCDIVVAIFRSRLGTRLPADFPPMPNGNPYPSGTAYEVLSAIEASKGRGLPDVYVFRFPQPPSVQLDDPKRTEIESQWAQLKAFFESWFKTSDGQFKAAFQTFTSTDDFESQIELLLRKWLEEKVLHGRSLAWPVAVRGSPFRGLASFGAKHATVFFGRNRDIARATDRLKDAADKACPFLLVVGASGSGKSSLVRAGLVPRLTAPGVVSHIDTWRVAVMQPGELASDPFGSLARSLYVGTEDLSDDEKGRAPALPELSAGDFKTPAELAALLGHVDHTSLNPIIGALSAIERGVGQRDGYDRDVKAALLLVIDQLDELFSAQISDDVRARFTQLLTLLVRSGKVWIVATLRADLFDRFLGQPALKQLKEDGASYDVAPPDAAELAEIVRGPALAADLVYETDAATGERLDERLLQDADRPDLLPLLQFTLNGLFEAREVGARDVRLTFAAYRAMGELQGAVNKHAESALDALSEAERNELPRLLRELAAPAQKGAVSAGHAGYDILSVPLAEAAHNDAAAGLVRALVNARILLAAGEGSQATVRLAHARVLDYWQRAKTIVVENADFYRIRAEVEEQRRRWDGARGSRDFLIGRGRPLAEAESLAARFPEELAPATREFIRRSGRHARILQTLTAAAAVLFALVAVAAIIGAQQAIRAERQAVESQKLAEDSQKLADAQRQRTERALATMTRMANELVFDIGQDPRVRGLPAEVRGRMLDGAIQGYDQAILLSPSASAYNGRGAAYAAKGDREHAIADYNQALALNPRDFSAYNNRGNVSRTKGDLDQAIADYDQALALNPRYVRAYTNRGYARSDKGDFDNAIADYNTAIRLDPSFHDAFNGRGRAYYRNRDYQRAIADYSEAIRLDPELATAYINRGLAYLYSGNRGNALVDVSRASELDPRNAFDALWVDIVGQRNNISSRLAQATANLDMTTWPAPLIRLYLGQTTPAAALLAADDPDAVKKKGKVCEANFYSAELALRQDAKDEAIRLFRLAARDCPRQFINWDAAYAELRALNAAP